MVQFVKTLSAQEWRPEIESIACTHISDIAMYGWNSIVTYGPSELTWYPAYPKQWGLHLRTDTVWRE